MQHENPVTFPQRPVITMWSKSKSCLASALNSEPPTHRPTLRLSGNCVFFFNFQLIFFFNTFNGSEAAKSPPQQKTRQSQWSAAWNKLPEIHRHSSEEATDFQSAPLEELQGNGLLFFSPRRFTFRQTSERASRRAGGRENNEDWHGRGIVRVGVRDGEWEP